MISAVFIAVLGSCGKERTRAEKVSAMIGQIEAPFLITAFTPQNIMDKSGIQDGALPFMYELIIGLFIDDAITGIDYDTPAQIIMGKGEGFTPNFYGFFKIKDQEKFKDLLKKEMNATIQEKDGYDYFVKEQDMLCGVWDEEFCILANIPMDIASMISGSGEENGQKMIEANIGLLEAADDAEINQKYLDFLGNEADISIMYNGEGFFEYLEMMTMEDKEMIEKMRESYEGSSAEIYLNFNKGSFDISYSSTFDTELKDKLNFFSEKGIEKNLLAYGKTENPIFIGGFSLDFLKWFDYVENELDPETYSEMESDIREKGFEVEEVKKALSGDFVLIVDEVVTIEKVQDFGFGDPIVVKEQEPVFAIVCAIKDMSVIEKAMTPPDLSTLSPEELEAMEENKANLPQIFENGVIAMGDAFIFIDGTNLFVTNDENWANVIAQGQGSTITDPTNSLHDYPIGVYANFDRLSQMKDLNDIEPYAKMLKDFHGGSSLDGGNYAFTFRDNSKNSLRVLVETVFNALAELDQLQNPDLQEELDKAVDKGFDALEEELPELEENVNEALDKLDESF